MGKRGKIVVYESCSLWKWRWERPIVPARSTKAGALRSARVFASKFKNPPEVVVEEEQS